MRLATVEEHSGTASGTGIGAAGGTVVGGLIGALAAGAAGHLYGRQDKRRAQAVTDTGYTRAQGTVVPAERVQADPPPSGRAGP